MDWKALLAIIIAVVLIGVASPALASAEAPQNETDASIDSEPSLEITDIDPPEGTDFDGGEEVTFEITMEWDTAGEPADRISISIGEDQYVQPQKEVDITGTSGTTSVTMTENIGSGWNMVTVEPILWGEDSSGSLDTDIVEYNVGSADPVAEIDCFGTFKEGEEFNCLGDLSSAPGGSIVEYEWSFMGQTQYGESVDFIPADSGPQTIELTVIDDSGNTDTTTEVIDVEEGDPESPPQAVISCESTVTVGDAVSCDASDSSHPDGSISSYEWEFDGDGSGSGVITSHAFSNTGLYTVELTVVGSQGLEDTATQTVVVEPSEPEITAVSTPSSAVVGESSTISVSADEPGGLEPLSYSWTIDDESFTGPEISYEPTSSGAVSGSVTVTNDEGESTTESFSFEVAGEQPEISDIEIPSTVSAGETVEASVAATDPDDLGPLEYSWEINGETFDGQSIIFSPDESGTIQGEVSVTNTVGVDATEEFALTVETEEPQIAVEEPTSMESSSVERLTVDYQNPNEGEVTVYMLVGGSEVDSAIVSDSSGSVTLSHEFEPGDQLIEIVVTDEFGEEASDAFEVSVDGQAPQISDFAPADSTVGVSSGEELTFEVSAADPDGDDVEVTWYVDGDRYQQGGDTMVRTFSEVGMTSVEAVVESEHGEETTQSWSVQTDTFRESPRVVDHTTAQQVDPDDDSPIVTFSFRNVDANERTAAVEIRAETPDGITLSGAQSIDETDGAQSVVIKEVPPGAQEDLSLEITVQDDDLEGSTASFDYEIIYYPVEDPTQTITVKERSLEFQVGDEEVAVVEESSVDDMTEADEPSGQVIDPPDDSIPGFTAFSVLLAVSLLFAVIRWRE